MIVADECAEAIDRRYPRSVDDAARRIAVQSAVRLLRGDTTLQMQAERWRAIWRAEQEAAIDLAAAIIATAVMEGGTDAEIAKSAGVETSIVQVALAALAPVSPQTDRLDQIRRR